MLRDHKTRALTHPVLAVSLPTRVFLMRPDAVAAAMLFDRINKHDGSNRLATYYEANGFGTLALAFRQDAHIDVHEARVFGGRTVRWTCPITDEGAEVRDAVTGIRQLRDRGDYSAAV